MASTILVEKLNLPTLKHSRPYNLQWLNDCGEVRMDRQVLVTFSIRKYLDEVPELVDASDDDGVVYPVTGESLVAQTFHFRLFHFKLSISDFQSISVYFGC